jgi:hypothetical protein
MWTVCKQVFTQTLTSQLNHVWVWFVTSVLCFLRLNKGNTQPTLSVFPGGYVLQFITLQIVFWVQVKNKLIDSFYRKNESWMLQHSSSYSSLCIVTSLHCVDCTWIDDNWISGVQVDVWWHMPFEAGTVTYTIQSNGKQIKEKCSFGVVVVSTYSKPYNVFIILLYLL